MADPSKPYSAKPNNDEKKRSPGERIRTRVESTPPAPFDKRIRSVRQALNAALVLAFVMIVALSFAPIEEFYTASGIVLPGESRELYAPAEATIAQILVDEGDRVTTGQVLMRFDLPELDEQIMRAEEELKNLQADLEVQNAKFESLKQLPLPKELWETKEQVAQSKKNMEYQASQLERLRKLVKEGAASQQEVDKTQFLFDQAKIDYDRLVKRMDLIGQGYTESVLGETEAEVRRISTKIEGVKERLSFLNDKRNRLSTLTAREPGAVLSVPKEEGEKVTRGEQLVYMDTGHTRMVKISGGERNIDQVRIGQNIRYKSAIFDPLLSDYAEGSVVEVSEIRGLDTANPDPTKPSRRTYFIYGTIDREPKGQELKLDSTVTVQIILRKDRLFKVLFGLDKVKK